MLTKMRLENFKSWRELELDLSNITILFGTNSSGKSSVLQSLLLLKQTAMGFDRSLPINFGGGEQDYFDFDSYRELAFGHDETNQVGITLNWDVPKKELFPKSSVMLNPESTVYTVRWQQLKGDVLVRQLDYDMVAGNQKLFLHTKWEKEDQYTYDVSLDTSNNQRRPETVSLQGCLGISPDSLSFVSSAEILPFQSRFISSLVSFLEELVYLGPLRSYPQRRYTWRGINPREIGLRGEKAVEMLLASELKNPNLFKQVVHWLQEMELVSKFQIRPIDEDKRIYETRVQIKPNQVESSLVDVGFGVSQVLPVITLLFSIPEGSIVLIEQPELHLHPCAQAHLADLLLHVAETRNLQLIIESHSEHLLARLQRRIAEAEQPFATPEHIKMYFCKMTEGGSMLEPVNVDKYGQIANWPDDFFGDISGDIEAMSRAGLKRRRQELEEEQRRRELSSND